MADDNAPTGRVQAIYVQVQPGVFREANPAKRPAEVWVEVKSYELPDSSEKGATVIIRTEAAVERGDIVSFRPADDSGIAPMPAASRILAITAKNGTAVAAMYGSAGGSTGY